MIWRLFFCFMVLPFEVFSGGVLERLRGQDASGLPAVKPAQVQLVSETATLKKNQSVARIGLRIALQDGWKTYWRNPGDAGLPMQLTWSQQENVQSLDVFWPSPQRYEEYGLQSVGYEHEVVFPIDVMLKKRGRDMVLQGVVDYLVCKDICLPLQDDISLRLVIDKASAQDTGGHVFVSSDASLLARYRSQVPLAEDISPIELRSVGGSYMAPWQLRVVAYSPRPFVEPDLFVEGEGELWFSEPQVTLRENQHLAVFSVDVGGEELTANPNLRNRILRLTLVDRLQSLDASRQADGYYASSFDSADFINTAGQGYPYLWILFFALLGGFILNFMPCVLPVLSIKLLNVASTGADRTLVREGFLFSVMGILSCFFVICCRNIIVAVFRDIGRLGAAFSAAAFYCGDGDFDDIFCCQSFGLGRYFSAALCRLSRSR